MYVSLCFDVSLFRSLYLVQVVYVASYVMAHEEEESDSASNCSNLSDGTLLHHMVQKLQTRETREDPWISLADALDPAEELPDPANAPTGDWYNPANPLSSAWTPCKAANVESLGVWIPCKTEAGTSSKAPPHSRPVTIKAKAKTCAKPLVRQKAFKVKVKTERNDDEGEGETMWDEGARAAAALDLGATEEPMQKRCKNESHDDDFDLDSFLEIQKEIDKIEKIMDGLIEASPRMQSPAERECTRKLIEALAAEKRK